MVTGLVTWLVIGLVAGFLASKIVNKRGEGLVGDILLGIVGAVIGGWLFKTFGKMTHVHPVAGVTGLNLESVFVAVVGAVLLLVLVHAARGRGI